MTTEEKLRRPIGDHKKKENVRPFFSASYFLLLFSSLLLLNLTYHFRSAAREFCVSSWSFFFILFYTETH